MSIKEQLTADLKAAMKNKDTARRDLIRSLQAAIKQKEVDERIELDDDAVIKILMAEAKRRRETIEAFEQAGRGEDAATEHQELAMIEAYLPKQLSQEELKALAAAVIAEVGATSAKDIGKVMPVLMPKVKGRADGRAVNEVVRELLS
ncbi:MAG: glutamyl-tRNA amidotransferase [Phototrophicales bacterium]|nr:MAG: glutamyl-tRNA amidotransferase [Phototrophicales bacterium]